MKKLPSLFRKKYTAKKLEKKIYKKLYVPVDREYVKSLFEEVGKKGKKQVPVFAIPAEKTAGFTKKEFKQITADVYERIIAPKLGEVGHNYVKAYEEIEEDFDKYSYPFVLMGWDYGQDIRPHAYTKDEWFNGPHAMFFYNVEKDKRILYES